jgi:hypothetical protein
MEIKPTGPAAAYRRASLRTLACREAEPISGPDGLQIAVDDGLNALEPIQFAHRHCHLGYPDHGQSPRP